MIKRCHAFSHDALGSSDAIELSQKLQRKELSPRDLAEASISRANTVQASLYAITLESYNDSDDISVDPNKPFSGIPTYIKDNLAVKGLPTSFGSAAVFPDKEKHHDPYAKQYLELGFQLLGKSSLPEFGFNATTEPSHQPATVNPWNLAHSSGASSGGAAALVAAGVVPIAHGNDGGGSIRIPAACCGLVGLKPSRGRHRNSLAAKSLPVNIVSEGVLTRSVRDTAYFHFEAEKHYRNPKLPALPLVTAAPKQRLRIGVILDSPSNNYSDEETKQTVLNTARLLQSQGHTVSYIDYPVPASFGDDFAHYWAMMAYAVKSTGKIAFNRRFKPKNLDPLTHGLASHYRNRAFKTPWTLLRLQQYSRAIRRSFQAVDVLLSPTLSHATPRLGHLSPQIPYEQLFERLRAYVGFTPLANVSGVPAISLPGALSSAGTPIGIQLMANLGQEALLLGLAYELEAQQPWQHLYAFK